MSTAVHDTYREREILEADGWKLVQLLYRKALDSLGQARRHLAAGEIEPRSREITRVSEILNELALALDHDSGGELSRNLAELYDYIQALLHTANYEQKDPPLAEAEQLVGTLLEAWESSGAGQTVATPAMPNMMNAEAPLEHVPVDTVG